MIFTAFEILTILFECLLIHIFFNAWFGLRSQKRLITATHMALFLILHTTISLLPLNPVIRMIFSSIFVFYIAAAIYKTTPASSAYSTLLFVGLAVISDYLCAVLLNAFSIDTDMLMTEGYYRIIFIISAKTVQLCIVLITASILRKNRVVLTFKQIIPLFPCLLISMFINIVFFMVFPDDREDLSLMLMIAVIGLLYFNGIVIFHTQTIKNATIDAQEQRLALQHYEMQEQYYKNIINDREEIRALWHDLQKQSIAISALVKSNGNKDAEKAYVQIKREIDKAGNVVDVGNSILNTILYHSITKARSANVDVKLSIHVPPELSVHAVDFSVIIGNTFDNALDECLLLTDKQPEISMTLIQKNSMLFYEIINPCLNTPHRKPGNIHGYGLHNVKRCVDKYQGSMENGIFDGHYRVSIRLNCNSKASSVNEQQGIISLTN